MTRLFLARFKLGMFDAPAHVTWAQIPFNVLDDSAHHALALEAARKSIVLLKNAGAGAGETTSAQRTPLEQRREQL